MIDQMTRKPLCVSTDGTAGPYIMVPLSQLPELRQLLDDHGILHLVEEDAISMNGEPEIATIDLGREVDVSAVQEIIDGVR
ncbi:hypothetical protein P12x_002592 [Tundrisphaera lichenicola]|uniref:hypothetical protein n=1 Tax=Tundrisphaera lichenicola TaxID=2029860 RepID=UPI003EBEAD73